MAHASQVEDRVPIKSSWNAFHLMRRKRLTDRKITQYKNRGWYSSEFKAARREFWENREAKKSKRQGNFIAEKDRLIYSPV